jgi:uncharacterized HAD superfamily protein
MKKLSIAIDCDDVIVPTASLIIDHYNKTYGTKVSLNDYYIMSNPNWNVDLDEGISRINRYMESEEYQRATPFVEAIEIIRKLSRSHELHVITGRADFLIKGTEHMLAEHFPDIFASIEFTNFYGETPRQKSEVCRELGIDLLIDDHVHHARTVAECGIDVLLFGNYPWNQAKDLPKNIRRVQGWQEVAEILLPANIATT